MIVFRTAILLLSLVAGVSFAVYALTADLRYRQFGWFVLKWTLVAAFGFFAVLIVERVR